MHERSHGRLRQRSILSFYNKNISGGFMLNWSLTFFVVAIIAAVFGFGGIAASATSVAKILFVLFLVLFVLSLIIPKFKSNV